MYVLEGSDCAIVPMERPNKEAKASAEAAEGRVRTKENDAQPSTEPTQSGVSVSQGLGGARRTAQARKQERFTALLHHLTIDLLRESYFALKRRAAPGVDGVSWQQYEQGLLTSNAQDHFDIRFPPVTRAPSLCLKPPKRRSVRGDQVSPPVARAWLFRVGLPLLRPASRFWNRAETPPMQAPPLFWHCP